jgi:hypothetical protein
MDPRILQVGLRKLFLRQKDPVQSPNESDNLHYELPV